MISEAAPDLAGQAMLHAMPDVKQSGQHKNRFMLAYRLGKRGFFGTAAIKKIIA
jgi:hypothetical protein